MGKKLAAIAFIIFSITALSAQTVQSYQALTAAKNFTKELQKDYKIKVIGKPIPLRKNGQLIAYLIKLYPQGFIITAPDKRLYPIKAFSTEGYFDTTSSNLLYKLLISQTKCALKAAKNTKTYNKEITLNKNAWDNLLKGTKLIDTKSDSKYGPWIPSVWGGVNCYDDHGNIIYVGNYYTPNHYSPGCVATSLSQIFYRYKWPLHGLGSHTDVDDNGNSTGSYYAYFYGTYYDWDNMLDRYYNKPSTDIQRKACGLLQYHCGISVDMDYEYNGSTSNINKVPSALSNYWRYIGHYQTTAWSDFWSRLKDNLKNGMPVQIGIETDDGAKHAIDIDGYWPVSTNVEYYHFNMGWWGSCNSWYNISSGFNACGYTKIKSGVFDILPVPELRVSDVVRTCDNHKIILRWRVSRQIKYDAFELQQSSDGGNTWTTLSSAIQDTFFVVSFPQNSTVGKTYSFRVRGKYAGHWYAGSYSNVINVAMTDDLTYLDFDGNDSYYILDNRSNDLDISDNWTIESWVNVDSYSSNSWSVIMDRKTVFSLYLINDNDADFAIRFVARDSDGNIIASLRSDNSSYKLKFHKWFHVAVSYDGNMARLFLNGKLVDSSSNPNFKLSSSTTALNIGARYWDGYSRYLDGKLDEIRISDTARYINNFTPDRFLRFKPDSHTRLLMHLDEGSGLDISDASGHFKYIRLRTSPNAPNWQFSSYGTTWNGNKSSDWNDAANWSAGVPDAQTLVHISSNATNWPIVNTNLVLNHLKIENNAQLTVSPAATLTIKGEFCNNGEFILENSDSSDTYGVLLDLGPYSNNYGTCTANYTYPKEQYNYVSSPIKEATSALFTNIFNTFNPDFYKFDETKAIENWDNGWTYAYTSSVEPDKLTPMRGYLFYCPTDDYKASFKGTFNSGELKISTTYSSSEPNSPKAGWNLLGNPYPSPIDWDKSNGWQKVNIANAIYTWNGKNFAYYISGTAEDSSLALGLNGGKPVIPAYQGFWVKAFDNGYVAINNNARVSFQQDSYKKKISSTQKKIILRIWDNNNLSDQTAIRFLPAATADFDYQYDAYKLLANTEVPQIFSINGDSTKFAINSLPDSITNFEIPIIYNVKKSGQYYISVDGINLASSFKAYLIDKKTATYIRLAKGVTYNFRSDSGQFANRFLLKIYSNQDGKETKLANIYAAHSTIYVYQEPIDNAKLWVYDIFGKIIYTGTISNYFTRVKVETPGIYIVKIQTNHSSQSKKLIVN